MPRNLAPPLPEGCPWSGYTPPNVDWCEAERCSWIVNPADTWSNLAYFAVALWIAYACRADAPRSLRLFAPATFVVGLFSLLYHASYTYILQFFDFLGMFVFCLLPIAINAQRLGWTQGDRGFLRLYIAGVTLATLAVPVLFETGFPIQSLVMGLILLTIGQELALMRRGEALPRGALYAGLALLTVAAGFSLADVTRTWCDPHDHFLQGHAIWHVLSALALGAFFRFYVAEEGTRVR